jgi:hypothetical protein
MKHAPTCSAWTLDYGGGILLRLQRPGRGERLPRGKEPAMITHYVAGPLGTWVRARNKGLRRLAICGEGKPRRIANDWTLVDCKRCRRHPAAQKASAHQ